MSTVKSFPKIFNARAVVTLTVEVEVDGNWDGDATVALVHTQAIDKAECAVRAMVHNNHAHAMRIKGEPRVEMLTHEVLG